MRIPYQSLITAEADRAGLVPPGIAETVRMLRDSIVRRMRDPSRLRARARARFLRAREDLPRLRVMLREELARARAWAEDLAAVRGTS